MNMLILLFPSTTFIVIIIFEKSELNRINKDKSNYSFILIINMWLLSRCISIDSLNSCWQQQRNKTSYDFRFCKGGSDDLSKR
jgi:hypothetical protein